MDKLKAMQHLSYICEAGSFSAAARLANVPVSTLSRSIQALETHLGAELLKRNTRHVTLTEIGKVYLEQCHDILYAVERVEGQVKSYQDTPAGILRISSLPHYAEFRLLPLLDEFQQRYPNIVIDIELSSQVTDLHRDGIDVAFRGGRAPDGRMIAQRLEDNTHRLCASPGYIDKYGTPDSVQALADHHALLYRSPAQVLHWHAERDSEWQRLAIRTARVSNSFRVILHALLNHQGLAMLPEWCISNELLCGDLMWIPTKETLSVISGDPRGGIYMLYQQPQYVIPKIKVAVDFFRARLTKA